jgi:hypothetical protein
MPYGLTLVSSWFPTKKGGYFQAAVAVFGEVGLLVQYQQVLVVLDENESGVHESNYSRTALLASREPDLPLKFSGFKSKSCDISS